MDADSDLRETGRETKNEEMKALPLGSQVILQARKVLWR